LGLRKDAVWLLLPLQVAADSDGRWLLDINYAVLNSAEVHVVAAGAPPQRFLLGNLQPVSQRPFASRSHALPLTLAPGGRVELWIRVETLGGMILPITLNKASAFHAAAIDEQLLQGLLVGLGLCLLSYSLVQAYSLREPMFLKYTLLSGGSLLFSVTQFGLGALYLWPGSQWLELHAAGVAALLAAAGTALFVEDVLRSPQRPAWFATVMHANAAALVLSALAYMTGLLHVHQVSWVVGTLGLLPALMGLPGALARARRGDSIGWYFLAAWLGYFLATWIAVSVIKGRLPATWWTLHAFQFGTTLDMLLFMRVMTLRHQVTHQAARQAAQERDLLRSMALSDALTGLPNRRGLAQQVDERLQQAAPGRLLALYLLDLDGFKSINDAHGHEVGDLLLVAVAERLRAHLRDGDTAARLGGDEFVVLSDRLPDPAAAEELGRGLLQAFEAPLHAGGKHCHIGLTVGYVLAPLDGNDVRTLMRAADAAMYAGKQAGRNTLRRAGVSASPAAVSR
ncbi:MAG: diguanylate cyclase, partial [Rubrivivax sp.]